ncbi:MAG: hypothetical protein CBC41_001020, partial [Flavobacteriaceae bacterium TMED81]
LNFNYLFRYDFLNEKLEVFLDGNIITRNILDNNYINNYSTDIKETIIGKQTLGFKYLFFDPFKNKKWHSQSVYSWNANRKIRLVDFIPAISAIAGSSFNFDNRIQYDDLFFKVKQPLHPDLLNDNIMRIKTFNYPEQTISPFIGIATQHHFKGRWVVVNNFFYEIAMKNPTFPTNTETSNYNKINYMFTITYNLSNPNWSIFGEFQTFKNKSYSDDFFKFGIANLTSKNSQVDLNFGGSFKTTPSYTYINVGFSQRFDWHKDISEEEKQAKKDFNLELKQRRKQQKVEKKKAITQLADHREVYKKQTGGRGKFADIVFTLEPAEDGKQGLEFVNEIKGGNVPREYIPSVEKGFKDAMQNGPLAGFEVDAMKVTLKDGSFHPVDSDSLSLELAAKIGYKEAARAAGAVVMEPMMKLEVLTPEENMGDIVGDLNRRRGQVNSMDDRAGSKVVKAIVPLSEMFGYVTSLRTLSSGRATSTMEFSHYAETPKNISEEVISATVG